MASKRKFSQRTKWAKLLIGTGYLSIRNGRKWSTAPYSNEENRK